MKKELKDLLNLLDLEQIERNIFRGLSPKEGWQRVYGGQVIGQALVAASKTVEAANRFAHSLHGYFLRPGDTEIPILYTVDRIRDGKCLLAYASDMTLLDTCYRPHGLGWINEKIQVASLDHSM